MFSDEMSDRGDEEMKKLWGRKSVHARVDDDTFSQGALNPLLGIPLHRKAETSAPVCEVSREGHIDADCEAETCTLKFHGYNHHK